MSTIASSPVATRRPATVTAAAALLALVAALVLPAAWGGLWGFDPVFLAIASTFAALRLVAAVGVWRCRRWAAVLGFVATLLDTLLALPGFFDGTWGGGIAGLLVAGVVVLGVATLVLLALPTSRRAYA